MHGRDRKNWARFAVLAAEIHLAWSSSSTRPDASPAAKREQYCDSRHNSTIFQTSQAAEATMKSAVEEESDDERQEAEFPSERGSDGIRLL